MHEMVRHENGRHVEHFLVSHYFASYMTEHGTFKLSFKLHSLVSIKPKDPDCLFGRFRSNYALTRMAMDSHSVPILLRIDEVQFDIW